jgi:uncharacterized protein
VAPKHQLELHVAEVLRHLGSRAAFEATAVLDGLATSTAQVPEHQPVTVSVIAESTANGRVSVNGQVRAPWVGECRRCLGAVEGELVADVAEVFETRPVEGETYPLVDELVDLEPMVRDAVLLALPLAPLCRDDCLGPRPDAFPVEPESDDDEDVDEAAGPGADRPPRLDPRWAALDQLSDRED